MANLLELTQQTIAEKSQWYDGETVTIWKSGNREAWVSSRGGWIWLQVFQDSPRLTKRFYSQKLQVGYFDPEIYGWVECNKVRENYPEWARTVKGQVTR